MKKKMKTKIEPAKSDSEDVILGLSYHIVLDIFCKVPIKKLLQFKTVCKSWLSLLSNPQFTKDLFKQTPPCFMMSTVIPNGLFIVDPEKASSQEGVSLRVPKPVDDDPRWNRDIVGSCNGVLCIRHSRFFKNQNGSNFYRFYILHPITGETLALPRLKNVKKFEVFPMLCAYGFGISPINHEYKVLVIMLSAPQSDERKAMVLTIGSKNWRSIGACKDPGNLREEMVYLNGFLHCFNSKSCTIHSFDIEREQFQEFQVSALRESSSHQFDSFGLGVLEGYLSLTCMKTDDPSVSGVWLMKNYGVKESWTKAFEISLSWCLRPLKLTEGKLILVRDEQEHGRSLMVYTPGTRSIERIEVVGMKRFQGIRLFVPNLVSLKDILSVW